MSRASISDAVVAAAYVRLYQDRWQRGRGMPTDEEMVDMAEEALAIAETFCDATIAVEWTCPRCGHRHEWTYPNDGVEVSFFVCDGCGKQIPADEVRR